ncbi:MAG: FecCD family ABC transporter permease [Caldisericia bacterium]
MNRKIFILILLIALIFVFLLSMSFGSKKYSFYNIIKFLINPKEGDELLLKIRFPRVISSFLVGASLSIAGLLSQTLFLNPLADPFLFGISSGANFFVTISLFFGWDLIFKFSLSFFSFLGALFATFIILLISRVKGKITPLNLLLAGIALSYLFSSISSFLTIWGRDVLNRSVFWTLSGFSSVSIEKINILLIILIPSIIFSLLFNVQFDAFSLGEDEAISLGVNVKLLKFVLLFLIALLTGISVYVSGIIGFIGLMVPNLLRSLFGLNHLKLIPLSIILGGLLLMTSDLIGRFILFPTEIPVSIITSFLGAPFFLYLLFKKRSF